MNGKTIPEVVGSNALLVGRKEGEVNADCMVTLKTGDGISIQCKLPPGESIDSTFVQVFGMVSGNTSVDAHSIIPLNENFDLDTYNAAVDMMWTDTHKPLFM